MIAPLLELTKGAQSNPKSELEASQRGFCTALRTSAAREGSPRRGGGRGAHSFSLCCSVDFDPQPCVPWRA